MFHLMTTLLHNGVAGPNCGINRGLALCRHLPFELENPRSALYASKNTIIFIARNICMELYNVVAKFLNQNTVTYNTHSIVLLLYH